MAHKTFSRIHVEAMITTCFCSYMVIFDQMKQYHTFWISETLSRLHISHHELMCFQYFIQSIVLIDFDTVTLTSLCGLCRNWWTKYRLVTRCHARNNECLTSCFLHFQLQTVNFCSCDESVISEALSGCFNSKWDTYWQELWLNI